MTIIIKPTYSCNFRCKYCYLSNSTKTDATLLNLSFVKQIVRQIKDTLEASSRRKITIIWHGGEPLLWGKENYHEIFAFIKQELADFDVRQSLQTNLSLIDDEYLGLFSHYNVRLGFSLDGTKRIHDRQRVNMDGQPTFDIIMKKLSLCRQRNMNPGCIVVGGRNHIGHIPELYQFMKKHNLNFKFNPLFISGEAKKNQDEYSITAQEYAQMCIELFDMWFYDSASEIIEANFVEIASNIATRHTTGCMFSYNCQDNFLAISPNGDVMPCGRFCDDNLKQYSYGNLHHESLAEVLPRIKQSRIYQRSEYIATSGCKGCKWYNICHGGCLHDSFLRHGDFYSKTLLCPAYKLIFAHIEQRMKEMNIIKC